MRTSARLVSRHSGSLQAGERAPVDRDLTAERKVLLAPVRLIALIWMVLLLAYLIFFPPEFQSHTAKVVVVVCAATATLLVSFRLPLSGVSTLTLVSPQHRRVPRGTIVASSLFMGFTAFVYAKSVGVSSVGSALGAFANLGEAYERRKQLQEVLETQSMGTVVVSAFGFLYTLGVPLLIMYWSRLSWRLRLVGLAGPVAYGGYFAATGTMKGFGDLLILCMLGFLAKRAVSRLQGGSVFTSMWSRSSPWVLPLVATALTLLLMGAAFASRLEGQSSLIPAFAQGERAYDVLGPAIANGVGTIIFYGTNGFAGLGFSFEASPPYAVYGGFRSISYLLSAYLDYSDQYQTSLPFQAEAVTGYSATVYWWTIFPWLASGFGWVGAVAFIGLVGALGSRLWVLVVYQGDVLATGLLGYVAILLAYVPANNQVFMSTGTAIGSVTLLAAFGLRGAQRFISKSKSREAVRR